MKSKETTSSRGLALNRENLFTLVALMVIFSAIIWFFTREEPSVPPVVNEEKVAQMFEEKYDAKPYTGKKVVLTNEEWRKRLTPDQYYVMREEGTEPAGSGKYDKFYEEGVYNCAACGLPLFSSKEKYDSKTGWPSFWAPIDPSHVGYKLDRSLFTTRVEVHCNRCGGHLGHVFNDGPPPTGHRYCINSVSLEFVAGEQAEGK